LLKKGFLLVFDLHEAPHVFIYAVTPQIIARDLHIACDESPSSLPSAMLDLDLSAERDFAHGKALLRTLELDVHDYTADTLVELAVEIFVEVRLLICCLPHDTRSIVKC
jgi:hypothetical protein